MKLKARSNSVHSMEITGPLVIPVRFQEEVERREVRAPVNVVRGNNHSSAGT